MKSKEEILKILKPCLKEEFKASLPDWFFPIGS